MLIRVGLVVLKVYRLSVAINWVDAMKVAIQIALKDESDIRLRVNNHGRGLGSGTDF